MRPSCSVTPPISCTSKWRIPSVRRPASRTAAKASGSSWSRVSPAARRSRNFTVSARRPASSSASNCGSSALTRSTTRRMRFSSRLFLVPTSLRISERTMVLAVFQRGAAMWRDCPCPAAPAPERPARAPRAGRREIIYRGNTARARPEELPKPAPEGTERRDQASPLTVLMYCIGSTWRSPLSTSRCRCAPLARPVCPTRAITWPFCTMSPGFTRYSRLCA